MFRRRPHAPTPTTEQAEAEPAQVVTDPRQKTGPTPKRSEAQANRKKQLTVPKDRKAAQRVARQRMRADREAQRTALVTGDEKALPTRDRGPMRRFCRDYVDSRTGIAEFFLPSAVVILILSVMPSPALKNISLLLWVLAIVLIVLDSVRLNISLKKQLKKRFPAESTKGCTAYSLMRSLQVRRMRLPKPQVTRGTKI